MNKEYKKILSERMKGENNPAKKLEVRKKISEAKIGHKVSEETKRKLSEAAKRQKRNIGWKHKLESIEKMKVSHKGSRAWNKGLKNIYSKETIEKIKKGAMGNKSHLGHKHNKETRKKISENRKGKLAGENHWNWQNGKSFEPYSIDWTITLKKAIRERDKYTCQICATQPEDLIIHHIDYDKQNCNTDNLITLCRSCHQKTNFNRDYWINYFKNNG